MNVLPRRGALGIFPIDDPSGLRVKAVAPDGPAARAGVRTGDRILASYGALQRLPAGVPMALDLLRDGAPVTVTVTPTAYPTERSTAGHTTLAQVDGAPRLRALVTRPRGVTQGPCVLYAQGYPLATCERVGKTDDPLWRFVEDLVGAGVTVVRVEKRGVGDSEGPAPHGATFADERDDLRRALDALRTWEGVDPDRVFVFGHSVGAMHAAALARERPWVRGVALYGAGVWTWVEYLAHLRRRVLSFEGLDLAAQEPLVHAMARFDARFYTLGASCAEALAAEPDVATRVGVDGHGRVLGRCDRYWHELAADPVALPIPCAALALWGTSDCVTFRDEHESLARLAGARGVFDEVPEADHDLTRCATMFESYAQRATPPRPYHPGVAARCVAWIRAVTS